MQDYNQNEERDLNLGEERYDYQETDKIPQTDSQGAAPEEKDFADQTDTPCQEGANDAARMEAESATDALKDEPTHSSVSYTPPYYVPDFVLVDDSQTEGASSDKTKKAGKGLGLTVAICTVATLLIGGVLGYFGVFWGQAQNSNKPNDSLLGTAIVNKNVADIQIEETLSSEIEVYTEVSSVAKAVADSVVEITTSKKQMHSFYGQYVTSGAGSGVILSQTDTVGIIVTNFHVVEGADEVIVRLTNGKEYQASYRGGDAAMDIAVLYISLQNGEKLTCATLGDSSSLVVGQRVVAIGNPLGSLGGTVTDGIVSALDRKIKIDGNEMTLLQTNAAINPGNSGGGLFDMAGRLVAIVNAKKFAEGIEGLGFAIPINLIEDAVAAITEQGYVKNRPSLGIQVSESVFFNTVVLYVESVGNSSSFRVGDCIMSINGTAIESKSQYNAMLSQLTIGENATVEIVRNNRQYSLTVPVVENTQNY